MKKNVIAALSIAGLAAVASAQTQNPGTSLGNGWSQWTTNFGTLQLRWAVDGDGNNAQAYNPIASSLTTLTPGPAATAVGLTLQARVAITGNNTSISTPSGVTNANYGIGRINFGTSNSYNRIVHNDSVSLSSATALQRGQTTVAQADTVGTIALNYGLFGATAEFRQFTGGYGSSRTNTSNWNAATGNPVANQNVIPGNAQTSGSQITLAANLSGSTRVRVSNGFIEAPSGTNGARIAAFDASVPNAIAGDVTANYSPIGTGFSSWSNVYRVVFVPRDNPLGTDPIRNVTVTFNGNVLYTADVSLNATINQTLLTFASFLGTTADEVLPVTFQVPTPGAAALLGLGGLAALRRRR